MAKGGAVKTVKFSEITRAQAYELSPAVGKMWDGHQEVLAERKREAGLAAIRAAVAAHNEAKAAAIA